MAMINREKLHSAFDDAMRNVKSERLSKAVIHSVIENAPTIEPKRGEWTENSAGNIICNQCGHYALSREKANYCHFCGADMRGETND